MENIIKNIKEGQGDDKHSGFNYARHIADEHEKKTGNKCIVRRFLDYADIFNGERREFYSFDVVELLK